MTNWRTREIINKAGRSPKRSRLLERSTKFLRKTKMYLRTLLLSWLSNRSIYRSHGKHMSCLRTSSHPVLSLSSFAVIFLLHSAFFFSLALALPPLYPWHYHVLSRWSIDSVRIVLHPPPTRDSSVGEMTSQGVLNWRVSCPRGFAKLVTRE